jgi:2-keto-4-pentenoate hydratase/2-oxohepta-3-ene-1,7-dioic acid hydratase in catechol pathway
MRWLRFRHGGTTGFGRLEGDTIHVHSGDLFAVSQPTGQTLPLASIEWLTPCQPTQMVAIWNNFRALAEKNGYGIPEEPLWLLKSPSSFSAHTAPIPKPAAYDGRVVYEGELGASSARLRAMSARPTRRSTSLVTPASTT